MSQEKYLLAKDTNKNILNLNKTSENKITYEKIEGDKQIHNIYGLFDVEQLESHKDYNLSEKIDSSFIHYNQIVRLRNVATKQYLGFDEFCPTEDDIDQKEKEYFDKFQKKILSIKNMTKQKKLGNLVLKEEPDDTCEWTFMESYIILNRDLYEKSKLEGITAKKKIVIQDQVENFVKKKDILRIFHCKFGKFLSFEDIDKNEKNDKYSFVTLNKQPIDNDLFQLSPSNENQSYEIYLILYFSENFIRFVRNVLSQELKSFLKKKKPLYSIVGGEKRKASRVKTSLILQHQDEENNKENQKNRIENIKTFTIQWIELTNCFEDISDFCINKYKKRYDLTTPIGKPVHNRQEFLREQKFLEITLNFLESGESSFMEAEDAFLEDKGKIKDHLEKTNNSDNKLHLTEKDEKEEVENLTILFIKLDKCIKKSFDFIFSLCRRNVENRKYVYENKSKFENYLLKYKEASKCLIDIMKDDENYMAKITQEHVRNTAIKSFKFTDVSESTQLPKHFSKAFKNPNTYETNINTNLIDNIFNNLNKSITINKTYDIHTFSLISKLMHSKDKGITINQSYILKKIQKENNEFLLKIEPNFKDIGFWIVYKTETEFTVCKSLVDLCMNRSNIMSYEKKIIDYLAIQLNLYADMCYLRNYDSIKKVSEIFPLDNLIYVISIIDINEGIIFNKFYYFKW